MKRRAWLFSALLSCTAGPALANGRYPIANQLVVSPSDPKRLALRTTFGLVLSEDQGKTFSWVCEKAAGFVNNEDPPIEITADNSIFVASSQALSISHDGGCAWHKALEELSVVDSDVDQSQPARAVAIASLYVDGGTRSGLQQTFDNGKTWQVLGVDFEGLPGTVALAPSDPKRIYASGNSTTDVTPLISTSADNGEHWQSYPLDIEQITVPFLAAVDPQHPGTVYVRAPTALGSDVLVMSTDFGEHFSLIFKAKGGLYGFALSPDGMQIAVGGPSDPLSVASTSDYAFKPVSEILPLCLKWSLAGLYACADEAKAGFSLGLSADDGAHFEARFHKPELALKACPKTFDTGLYCPQAWEGQQAVLGIDAGVGGGKPSEAGAANELDAGMVAAEPDASAASGAHAGGAAGTTHTARKSSGCAVIQRPARSGSAWLWCAGGALLALGTLRRRI